MAGRHTPRPRFPRALAILALALVAVIAVAAVSPAGPGYLRRKKADRRYVRGPVVYVRSEPVVVAPGDVRVAAAVCPDGFTVLSGGGYATGGGNIWANETQGSYPGHGATPGPGTTSWQVELTNMHGSEPSELRAYAVCARAAKVSATFEPGRF